MESEEALTLRSGKSKVMTLGQRPLQSLTLGISPRSFSGAAYSAPPSPDPLGSI